MSQAEKLCTLVGQTKSIYDWTNVLFSRVEVVAIDDGTLVRVGIHDGYISRTYVDDDYVGFEAHFYQREEQFTLKIVKTALTLCKETGSVTSEHQTT